ncbi:MAG: energy-coupling factor transporter transmembrane component T family protein [Bacillota bacterium]|uniref:energy-coupling factor transporter transmembrane component T family protein n=1 Tax=Desulfurispora thermophila TaxID=265470 RepID=UPI00036D2784|nr:energy-coupling factor transporter transmembrane component T [Desulfurispora thermophila]
MAALLEYTHRDFFLHRLHPATKLLWSITVLILSFLTDSPLFILALLLSNLLLAAAGGVLKEMLPTLRGLTIFAAILVLLQIFLVEEGKTLFYLIPTHSIGRVTDTGLQMSAVAALRMLATVSTIPILLLTTRMTDLATVLVEKCRIPYTYAFMFLTALRLIPTLMGEMEQVLQAQAARGYQTDTRHPMRKMRIILPLAIPLLVTTVQKIEQTAISMEMRGFASGPRSSYRTIKMQPADYLSIGLLAVVLAGCILWRIIVH